MPRKKQFQESISNLSMGLINAAFKLLEGQALPIYRKNIDRRRPPVAGTENVPSAAAILLLNAGLDYHLCRLKYMRDIAQHSFPLPHTPYFNWEIDDYLHEKISKLLIKQNENHLKEQLLEVTAIRDCVVHPKFYEIKEAFDADYNFTNTTAKLVPGSTLRSKARDRKMKHSELTRLLRLPFVPTWISYSDAVLCVLVLHRFLNLLERRYGNYAALGSMFAESQFEDFFTGRRSKSRCLVEIDEWVNAFYNSLSSTDQERVNRTLGGAIHLYLKKKQPSHPRMRSILTVSNIVKLIQNPRKPDFLRKPPPWSTTKTPSP